MIRVITLIILMAAVFVGWSNVGFAQCEQGNYDFAQCFRDTTTFGNPFAATTLLEVLENIGGFLVVAAGILAGIVIITAGLVYMSAGNDSGRVTTAKAIFKNGVIGALILFMAGIIVNTIVLLAIDPLGFFT